MRGWSLAGLAQLAMHSPQVLCKLIPGSIADLKRETDCEGAALPFGAFHADGTTVEGDDLFGHIEPDPDPADLVRFGVDCAVKALEQMLDRLSRNTHPLIAH